MQAHSRKRPAPGTSPAPPNAQQETYPSFQDVTDASQQSTEQLLPWGKGNDFTQPSNSNQTYPSFPDSTRMAGFSDAQQQPNQLVRRNMNNQLTTRDGRNVSGVEAWPEYESTPSPGLDAVEENDTDLEAKAAAAKRDALFRRPPKQIPPFIQKLVSFLEKNYTDLIRWSDAGDSFIVVDEDKFAQKLIPELFKHNNYASFVRQLNMYGFHKVVGLSDNSMRASEKKAKTPSEYKHRYFKRGHPELLWLIEKPKTSTATARKKNVKHETHDDDDEDDDDGGDGHLDEDQTQPRNKDLGAVSKADLDSLHNLRREVESLQKSQQQIYAILARMRDENNQYIRQASAMVANHERHESSINAILTFLATFYNQSLEDRTNAGNMFSHAIHNNQPQGSVFDVGDYESPVNQSTQIQTIPRRPLALLPPPSASDGQTDIRRSGNTPRTGPPSPATVSESPRRSAQQSNYSSAKPSPRQASMNTPSQTNDNDEILNVINRSNANAPQSSQHGPNFDFNSALQHYQNSNAKGPLTNEQRDAMLSIMASQSGTSTPAIANDNNNNTNANANANLNANLNANANGNAEVNPYFDYFNSNQDQIDMLQRMQQEQDSKVQELAGRLSPLSPDGSIPGLALPYQSPSFNPSSGSAAPFDFNSFINDDFLDGNPNEANDADPDFDFGVFGGDEANDGKPATGDSVPEQSAAGVGESNDGSLFGDGGDNDEEDGNDEDGAGDDQDATPSVKTDNTPGGGRIVGSVASSSGRPTPSVEDAADDEDGDGGTAVVDPNPPKRRRTTRR